jgi:hypothetical protein
MVSLARKRDGECALRAGSTSSVTIVLGITAALAIAGPAWRAVRIDPAIALRNE